MHILICLIAIMFGQVSTAFAQQTVVGERLRIAQDSDLRGDVGHPDYISQLNRWLITQEGAGDFRYLFADEAHFKSFIADLEQALAGGQIITKSVTTLASAFTVPVAGATATLTLNDLPSADGMAVFQSGDTIRLRTFSRAAGELVIGDVWGIVTGYTDQPDGVQDWTFTRNTGADAGSLTAGTIINPDAIVLDYGVAGNGYHEVNAIDGLYGQNSPYSQIVTWSGASPIAANLSVRTRLGNLRGITGVANEYGLIAGAYDATPDSSTGYFRASNQAFELVGINLSLYDGATRTFHFDRTTPYFAMGNGAPSAYGTGVGCWQGKDAGVYKWRCGNPSGDRIEWDGTTLNVVGTITVTGGGSAVSWNDLTDRPVSLTDGRVATAISSTGVLLNTVNAAPSGSGLFLGADKMGFYTAGAWNTYMDNAGNFYLGGTSGSLQWNGTTLTIVGSGTFTGSVTASSGTIGGWTLGATTLTGGDAILSSAGNLTLGTSNNVFRASATDATYRLWVGHATAASAPFRVSQTGAVTMTNATITGGSLTIGDVEIDSGGLLIQSGSGLQNSVAWSDGSSMSSVGDNLTIIASSGVTLAGGSSTSGTLWVQQNATRPNSNNVMDLGTTSQRFRDIYIVESLHISSFDSTTSADYPVVFSTGNERLYHKTGGINGNTVCAAGFNSIDFHRGIAVSHTCF